MLEAKTITLEKPKGEAERAFTAPMQEELAPLFTRLKQERTDDQTAYDFVGTGSKWEKPSKMWWRFFKQNDEMKLPHLCFHCTRGDLHHAWRKTGYSPIQNDEAAAPSDEVIESRTDSTEPRDEAPLAASAAQKIDKIKSTWRNFLRHSQTYPVR